MNRREFMATMHSLLDQSRKLRLSADSKLVFLSDLHMGDGGKSDDFRDNAALVKGALEQYYLPAGHTLVLNGDIEELHKFTVPAIRRAWPDHYSLFKDFDRHSRLVKIIGNHDLSLLLQAEPEFKVEHALCLEKNGERILVFHGHQSHKLFMKYNYLSDFLVRYIADPLGIRNAEKPLTSRRRYKAERRIYRAARDLGLVVIAGHTHRPLFESYTKYDRMRWKLESLFRDYARADQTGREALLEEIRLYVAEFRRLSRKECKRKVSRSLYEREEILVPCMLNSGCATSRSGFTALELEHDQLQLVYWARQGTVRSYIERDSLERTSPTCSPWVRHVLARDSLDYIFARTRLLTGDRLDSVAGADTPAS